MNRLAPGLLLLSLLLLVIAPARSAERMALLPFALENTSLEPDRPDELARIDMLDDAVGARLREVGFELVDPAPVAAEIAALSSVRGCNGCEIALGRKLGASEVAFGWVQKVSNLILNINMVVRDVRSGRLLAVGSVDIRGNTDEAWRRGVVYLLEHRILPALGH
jgi:hypothetical protein